MSSNTYRWYFGQHVAHLVIREELGSNEVYSKINSQ